MAASLAVARFTPPKSMLPREIRMLSARRRMIASAVVDLPLPVSPTTPTSSPGRTSRSTPRRIAPRPRRLATSTHRSRTASSGGGAPAATPPAPGGLVTDSDDIRTSRSSTTIVLLQCRNDRGHVVAILASQLAHDLCRSHHDGRQRNCPAPCRATAKEDVRLSGPTSPARWKLFHRDLVPADDRIWVIGKAGQVGLVRVALRQHHERQGGHVVGKCLLKLLEQLVALRTWLHRD